MPRIVAALGLLIAFAGCQDRQFLAFGYRFGSTFDPSIRTVSVPIFRNLADQTSPSRNLEADLTEAIVREINSRPGLRVANAGDADSELNGTILNINKSIVNRNQQNQWRDGEVLIAAQVVWKARDGRILSNRRRTETTQPTLPAFDPSLPPPPAAVVEENAIPVTVVAGGRLLAELGESNATAQQIAVRQLARQIVNMMEEPW